MQQSSGSIGALATALAKAQIELVNPEKSMIATIRSDDKGGAEQIFRYAPLSSGLEILRKTLGQHENAILQATTIDQPAGVVKLTTTLCHSSGEWVGSTWPVCPVEDMASPKRMGAALTYARRHALFTLAGIAGEDDLDAPDLNAPDPAAEVPNTKQPANGQSKPNGRQRTFARKRLADCEGQLNSTSADPALRGQLSAVLRDHLRNELDDIDSAEAAAVWARRILPAKNSLNTEDARLLEDAFQAKLAELNDGASYKETSLAFRRSPAMRSSDMHQRPRSMRSSVGERIDKSDLAHPEPRRIRDREHVRFVAKQPCLICGRTPSDPHHLRFAQRPALGRKVSDEFTVPLCRGHNREVHHCGDEVAWWQKVGIDPTAAARALWLKTHPLPTRVQAEIIEGPARENP
jgi:ERF superfamily